jgi:hypothetical protein
VNDITLLQVTAELQFTVTSLIAGKLGNINNRTKISIVTIKYFNNISMSCDLIKKKKKYYKKNF